MDRRLIKRALGRFVHHALVDVAIPSAESGVKYLISYVEGVHQVDSLGSNPL